MKILGMMRVRNEARWIERCVRSLLSVCETVHVMDDRSDDGTLEILRGIENVTVHSSPFGGLDETRDKNWLLGRIGEHQPDWIVHIDGDEELAANDAATLRHALECGHSPAFALHVLYLWDSPDLVRVDGVYRNMRRPSVWRPCGVEFRSQFAHGFHCGNVPRGIPSTDLPVRLLHWGYMDRADRLRKFEWYNEQDPHDLREDEYRHIVQGDLETVPADARLKHAGPLELQPFSLTAA